MTPEQNFSVPVRGRPDRFRLAFPNANRSHRNSMDFLLGYNRIPCQ
ncbi:hypothetical protein RESH_04050 [Rhodopirellula europaea SH398]|uniref:Uncharacterized protein n=1 Tax=Rhodopirellula europaea SH398 TaxID=1263868 RepID=M5S1A8_9BACT|nr:hypothetical protein RESH_04050 [Rhodopirellula europaea SH398]